MQMEESVEKFARRTCSEASRDGKRKIYLGWGLLLCVALAIGWRAVCLNLEYYQDRGPFFDSMSYHQRMYDAMATAGLEGPLHAIRKTCLEGTTVCFPFLIASLIGPFVAPSRLVGVWIQVGELLLLATSMHSYFVRVHRLGTLRAIAAVLPVFGLAALYHNNGGLQDFRMDLSLMLTYGLVCVRYLIARHTLAQGDFVLLGATAAMAALFRATAPVYLAFALGPVILWDGWNVFRQQSQVRETKKWLRQVGMAAVVCILLSGWFFAMNYRYLKYYYTEWNVDALAKLPWNVSVKHFEFACRHVGEQAWTSILTSYCVVALVWSLKENRTFTHGKGWLGRLGSVGIPLWIGIAPAAMLTLRGAGLNPFVSMPSAWGFWFVVSYPIASFRPKQHAKLLTSLLLLVATYFLAVQARIAPGRDFGGSQLRMDAGKLLIRTIASHAHDQGLEQVRFGTAYIGLLHPIGIENIILFDLQNPVEAGYQRKFQGVRFVPDSTFSKPSPEEWKSMPGDSIEEKIAHLLVTAESEIDYLLIPEPASADWIRANLSHIEANRHVVDVRAAILKQGTWLPVSSAIPIDEHEVVRLYQNEKRHAAIDRKEAELNSTVEVLQAQ